MPTAEKTADASEAREENREKAPATKEHQRQTRHTPHGASRAAASGADARPSVPGYFRAPAQQAVRKGGQCKAEADARTQRRVPKGKTGRAKGGPDALAATFADVAAAQPRAGGSEPKPATATIAARLI